MPRVTIALPVFNGANYVREALNSCVNQDYDDYEVLVVDDASTDETGDIVQQVCDRHPRVRYLRNESNIGAAGNFNRAFEVTDSEFFKWAAHDDRFAPAYLRKCVNELQGAASAVICHSESALIDEDGNTIAVYDHRLDRVGDDRPSIRFRDWVLVDHWCIDVFGLIRRSTLARTELIGSYVGSDRVLLAQLALAGKFCRVPEVLFENRDHPRRSVVASTLRSRERLKWFDPSAAGAQSMPAWRCLREYQKAISQASISSAERRACYRTMGTWLLRNRWDLSADVNMAAKALFGGAQ